MRRMPIFDSIPCLLSPIAQGDTATRTEDKTAVFSSNSLFDNKNIIYIVKTPAKAEGNLTAKDERSKNLIAGTAR